MFKLFQSVLKTEGKIGAARTVYSFELTRKFSALKIDDLNKTLANKTDDDKLRCKLASAYRLVGLKNWDMGIYNHITIRSEENSEHFLINPFGLLYPEITASSLVKIDANCNVIEHGSNSYGVNKAGFTLHSAIHDARSDVNAVIHVHTPEAAGISALKCGLLPISQEALICTAAGVGYHDYEGILIDEPMKQRIADDLGFRRILVLRNHGAVFCGNTIEEAYLWLITFMTAVKVQFMAMSAANGVENLIIPPPRVVQQVAEVLVSGVNAQSSDGIDWNIGEMDFEAEMRKLDSEGYNTGYEYKTAN